ncbi:unnamed protein product [Moneuplotes crassus]|uniref:Uncharacterized protein n=1 Tax=Euplotes crassus TaxID=5936 RepID=A0AAD1U2C0_EUPCR|nr:unnamed protein product [Moneuplotes crassus]
MKSTLILAFLLIGVFCQFPVREYPYQRLDYGNFRAGGPVPFRNAYGNYPYGQRVPFVEPAIEVIQEPFVPMVERVPYHLQNSSETPVYTDPLIAPTVETIYSPGYPPMAEEVYVPQYVIETLPEDETPCGEGADIHKEWNEARDQARGLGFEGREVAELCLTTIAGTSITTKQFACVALELGISENLPRDEAVQFSKEIAKRSGTPEEVAQQWADEFIDKITPS